jgi:hypothetical protein
MGASSQGQAGKFNDAVGKTLDIDADSERLL